MSLKETKLSSLDELEELIHNSQYKENLSDYEKQEVSSLFSHSLFRTRVYYDINSSLELSSHQNKLYSIALYGLSVYSPDEINAMSFYQKREIMKTNLRAQKILNLYKQEVTNALGNKILEILFPNSKITSIITKRKYNKPDPHWRNKIELKNLGITKLDVITLFIKENILSGEDFKIGIYKDEA